MTTKDPAPTISELPELPPMTEWKYRTVGYTAAQMRAYVLADRAARRSTEGWVFPNPIDIAAAMTPQALKRTSGENIADVLFAIAKASAPTGAAEEKGQES